MNFNLIKYLQYSTNDGDLTVRHHLFSNITNNSFPARGLIEL